MPYPINKTPKMIIMAMSIVEMVVTPYLSCIPIAINTLYRKNKNILKAAFPMINSDNLANEKGGCYGTV